MSRLRARILLGILGSLALIGLARDLSRQPEDQWSAGVLLTAIDLYQTTLSSRMNAIGVRCRFEPTCSHYAEAVIRRDGVAVGTWRAAQRLARCGPWTPAGTEDQP